MLEIAMRTAIGQARRRGGRPARRRRAPRVRRSTRPSSSAHLRDARRARLGRQDLAERRRTARTTRTQGDDPRRRGLRGRARRADRDRRRRCKAPIVHAMRGKEFIEYDNPFDVGMTGLLGFCVRLPRDDELRRAADARDRLSVPAVLSGQTRGSSRSTCAANRSAVARRLAPRAGRHREGDARRRCSPCSMTKTDAHVTSTSRLQHYAEGPQGARRARDRRAGPDTRSIRSTSRKRDRRARARTTRSSPATSARRRSGPRATCTMNGKRRLLGSFTHGSMANALPQAIGAQADVSATGRSSACRATAGSRCCWATC